MLTVTVTHKGSDAHVLLSVALFGSFGDGRAIKDPYYGWVKLPKLRKARHPPQARLTLSFLLCCCRGDDGFEKTYQQCMTYSEGLLADMGFDSK